MALLIYVMLVAPYTICFGIEYGWLEPLGIIDMTIDILFALDIYLNFRTGVVGGCSCSASASASQRSADGGCVGRGEASQGLGSGRRLPAHRCVLPLPDDA
jgi:hypothetical protein